MLNLAIECSGVTGSVALARDGQLVDELQLPQQSASVQSLAPAVAALLHRHCRADAQVDLISVTVGPGSFTGLRVGLATAKLLGWAWGTPLAAVDTLHAVAARTLRCGEAESRAAGTVVVPVLNAFRRQVFVAAWRVAAGSPGAWERLSAAQVVDAPRWQAAPLGALLPTLPAEKILVTGPGLKQYQPVDSPGLQIAPEACWQPSAADVAELGQRLAEQGQVLSADRLLPNYVRASAAEEKAAGGAPPSASGRGSSRDSV